MTKSNTSRKTKNIASRKRSLLTRRRNQIAKDLSDMISRGQMRKEARDEPTLSGKLRRAIHASSLSLIEIAAHANIPPLALDEFLAGERTLRSDVLDRLAANLGFALSR